MEVWLIVYVGTAGTPAAPRRCDGWEEKMKDDLIPKERLLAMAKTYGWADLAIAKQALKKELQDAENLAGILVEITKYGARETWAAAFQPLLEGALRGLARAQYEYDVAIVRAEPGTVGFWGDAERAQREQIIVAMKRQQP